MSKVTANKIAGDSKLKAAEEMHLAAVEYYRKSEELLKNKKNLISEKAERVADNYKRQLKVKSKQEDAEYREKANEHYIEKLRQVDEEKVIWGNFISGELQHIA